MSELIPIPLPVLLRRAFLEYERQGAIFDLPKSKFFRGFPDVDLSVNFHGHRASTPLGPAAGPHGQLIQNIVLSWLAGSRIIELKTVQILDELKIPRPCIDVANIGYNVEWSQELKLEKSLREYVGGAMFLEILKASKLLGDRIPSDTIFDMSVGYSLEGIRSPRVRGWIESMLNAAPIIDELRAGLTGEFARYRDLPFPERLSDTISLSTFHGCPANEIEGIVTFLLEEMGCHVCIKLNPTLLGKEEVRHLLHDVLGYHEIEPHGPAFDNDLQFDEALDLIPRLQGVARRCGRSLGVKFTNTLVVKNKKTFFSDEQMYMSGAPLHILAINLIKKFREHVTAPMPVSFSAGLDANNVARAVAMNLVPVTTCTDLLRPGGYGRLIRYLERLAEEMRKLNVTRIPDFIMKFRGQGCDVERAGRLNTPILVAEATADPRYTFERNKAVPRKIGSKLWLYDCINCDKCVPVCPNDANFAYETQAAEIAYDNFELADGEIRRLPGGVLPAIKAHQLANYADACNECGNCDVFCPEDGGPYIEKPRFFGSLESYKEYGGRNGFFIGGETIHGIIAGEPYVLALDTAADRARFRHRDNEIELRLSNTEPVTWSGSGTVNMLPYYQLKVLLQSITDTRRINFINAQQS
jgi:putative selenate reductase